MRAGSRTALLLVAPFLLWSCSGSSVPARDRGDIERVVDGDTVIVRVGENRLRVRLIGIDTPEVVKPGTPVQCYGREASAEVRRLLEGEAVHLEYDRDRLDAFRRTLAYVYRARDQLFVNEHLLAKGFARVLEVAPNDRHAADLADAERTARAAGLGLWGACAN